MAKGKAHRSANRRERARQTRNRILEAGYRLFCERGWDDTTMQSVADGAGVAVQTVYFGFRTKANLLAAVEEHAILGDAPRPLFFQEWAKRAGAVTDPRALIRLFVETDTAIKARLTPLVAGLGGSMPARSGRDSESGRDEFFGSLIDRLEALGALNDNLSHDRALDILRVVNTQGGFGDLTRRRGWTNRQWIAWMSELLASQLLRSDTSPRLPRRPARLI